MITPAIAVIKRERSTNPKLLRKYMLIKIKKAIIINQRMAGVLNTITIEAKNAIMVEEKLY
jgi:hypothetical protein